MRIHGSLDAGDVHLFLFRLVSSARSPGISPTVGVPGVGACDAGNSNTVKLGTGARNPRLFRQIWRWPALAPRRLLPHNPLDWIRCRRTRAAAISAQPAFSF